MRKEMCKREVFIGVGLGGLLFLAWQGYEVLPVFVGVCLLFLVYTLADRRSARGSGSFGLAAESHVVFDDIGGHQTAKRELKEALAFLVKPKRIQQLGVRPLRGVLLAGPPGTGKTLLAKAAAACGESLFFVASGSQFVEMYAGVGASRIRQLFSRARLAAQRNQKDSAIVFIDEIDVLGAKRGSNANHMEYDQTLNELLTQMDGIRTEESVRLLVIGATNREDMLDPALMRPGRFDRVIRVGLPDKEGRWQILQIHAKEKPLDVSVDLETIAEQTYGFSGAHLESLMNEAAILAMRRQLEVIGLSEIQDALEKVLLGESSDRCIGADERRRIAVHECGHALAAEAQSPGSVASVNICPRESALGHMRKTCPKDQSLYTADELKGQIQVFMGGAVAEELVLGQRSTGSANDMQQAWEMASKLIDAGLSDLGVVGPGLPEQLRHETVNRIVTEQEENVRSLLEVSMVCLQEAADRLLRDEKLTGEQFRTYIGRDCA